MKKHGYVHYHFKLTRRESFALTKFLLNEKLDMFDKQAINRAITTHDSVTSNQCTQKGHRYLAK